MADPSYGGPEPTYTDLQTCYGDFSIKPPLYVPINNKLNFV